MSTYSTGELAKRLHVSVRTLQYYDQRGLLRPTSVTTGGRRQYTPADQDRLELILFLKELGLSLTAIQEILASSQGNQVLTLLLAQQEQRLLAEKATTTDQLKRLAALQRRLPTASPHPLTSKTDIDQLMTEKQNLARVHRRLIGFGLVLDVLEFGALIYGFLHGNWWPFIAVLPVIIALALWLSWGYFRDVNYVCPNCQTVFKPTFKQAFWARHTPKARKLTCPHCHQRNYCVEIFDDQHAK